MLFKLFSGNFTMLEIIADILAVLLLVFLVLPFHEWAHAFTAYCLGDKGIMKRGRLSLNPLSHIDPIGALMILLIGFGWAKPVPIDPRYFKRPKLGMAITAIMGPVANLVAALAGVIVLNLLLLNVPSWVYEAETSAQIPLLINNLPVVYYIIPGLNLTLLGYFLQFYITANIGLAVFNLIPIPPLDGSKVMFLFMPNNAVNFFYRYQNIFYLLLFVLLMGGALNGLLDVCTRWLAQGIGWLAALPFRPFIGW